MSRMRAHTREFRESAVGMVLSYGSVAPPSRPRALARSSTSAHHMSLEAIDGLPRKSNCERAKTHRLAVFVGLSMEHSSREFSPNWVSTKVKQAQTGGQRRDWTGTNLYGSTKHGAVKGNKVQRNTRVAALCSARSQYDFAQITLRAPIAPCFIRRCSAAVEQFEHLPRMFGTHRLAW